MYFEFNSSAWLAVAEVIGHRHRVVEQEVIAEADLQSLVVLHSLAEADVRGRTGS